jgi:site-specific DNA-methyltransferase (adenine-specific)
MKPITTNTLFYGDNLPILREHLPNESVDLVYLDPPFNSNRSYNVLFKNESGQEAEAQITAFDDTWHWDKSAAFTYHELIQNAPADVVRMIGALREFIGENQMLAYLVMMTARLIELRRVLKPTGSLYLHCDPTASHYLKIVLDTIFGPENFLSEVIWKRSHAHNSANKYGPIHDVILYYCKTEKYLWKNIRQGYAQDYVEKFFKFDDRDGRGLYWTGDITGSGTRNGTTGTEWRGFNPTDKGRHWMVPPDELEKLDTDHRIYWPQTPSAWPKLKRYLNEAKGIPLQDIWDDIYGLSTMGAEKGERLGYPTQKPLALLERIIQASSNEGDVVLDPFCGCGTAVAAAQKLNRRWIGIDVTHLSIALMKYRLKDNFELVAGQNYQVVGEPEDLASAQQLAHDDRYQFQWWALSLIGARPLGGESGSKEGKKGSDRGIDGVIYFVDDKNAPKSVVVQVKSGHVNSGLIRDLVGTLKRENAALSVFVTLEEPSKDMLREAASADFYVSELWQKSYPKIQILTIAALLNGQTIQMPPAHGTFKKAERIKKVDGQQGELFG